MGEKRGYFKQLMYDFVHLNELMPSKVEVYSNKEDGIEAFEIVQPPNQYVASHIKYFEDKKRGILRFSWNDKDKEIQERLDNTKLLR